MQCYKYNAATRKVKVSTNSFYSNFKIQYGELPAYVDYMIGFSYEHKSMYFADKSGGKIASKDGKRMIMMESAFVLPDDIENPLPLPGLGSAELSPVEIPGGYTADFYGISYKVNNMQICISINFFIFPRNP